MVTNTHNETHISLDRFIVLDIETTGINCQRDKIIEIAAVKYENFKEVNVFSTLVNPMIPLPNVISRLTGISQSELDSAPTWEEVQDEFLNFIGDLPLVGHNLCNFDIRFIEKSIGHPLSVPMIDTLDLSRYTFPELPVHKLSYLKNALGIDIQVSHRALDDVRATCALFQICLYELAHGGQTPILNCSCEENHPNHEESNSRASNHRRYGRKIDIKSILPTCECIDPSSPLCGKNIVFTGTLSMPREEAMQLAVNAGAVLKTSVSRKTDFLVVGHQDISVVGSDGMSSKEEKAHELNNSGKAKIQIISENEFVELIRREGAAV